MLVWGVANRPGPVNSLSRRTMARAYGCLRKLHNGALRNDGLANMLLALGYDDENGVRRAVADKT